MCIHVNLIENMRTCEFSLVSRFLCHPSDGGHLRKCRSMDEVNEVNEVNGVISGGDLQRLRSEGTSPRPTSRLHESVQISGDFFLLREIYEENQETSTKFSTKCTTSRNSNV